MNKKKFIKKNKKKIYIGLADCHGIESFIEFDKNPMALTGLSLRAIANDHRHAVVFKVMLDDLDANEVRKFLSQNKFRSALRFLKMLHTGGDVELYIMKGRQRSWNLIPNSDLDPYNSGPKGEDNDYKF